MASIVGTHQRGGHSRSRVLAQDFDGNTVLLEALTELMMRNCLAHFCWNAYSRAFEPVGTTLHRSFIEDLHPAITPKLLLL